MTAPERGPIETATGELATWLARVSGQPVRVGPPLDGDETGLSLWPFELRPERQTRGTGARHPYRFAVRYVVAAANSAGLGLLDGVLTEAVRAGEPAISLDGLDPAVWAAVGVAPRPVLVLDVPAVITHPVPDTPLVLAPLVLKQLDMRPLAGEVLGPGDQPVAGVRVEVLGTELATYTNRRGQFSLAGVPGGDRIGLRLLGRGRVFTAEVSLTEGGPVVIHCAFTDEPADVQVRPATTGDGTDH